VNDNWPPKSPHEVLMYTPGGRERLKRLAERSSPSPSPSKRPISSAYDRRRKLLDGDLDSLASDDDDEETLQLQLQEIQARLKLKKLQKRAKQGSDTENEHNRTGAGSLGRSNSVAPASRAASRISDIREDRLQRSKPEVHVPASPVRRVQAAEPQKSPSRVLLGIDKGLRGNDISLKRAPSFKKPQEDLKGPFLQRPISQAGGRISRPGTSASQPINDDRPKTFNERMATIRTQEAQRQERDLRIQKKRSSTFDIDEKKMQSFKDNSVELTSDPRMAPDFSREDVLNALSKPVSTMPRSKTAPDIHSAMRTTSRSTSTATSTRSESLSLVDVPKSSGPTLKPSEVTESEASSFEPFSSAHLSKRIIPHKELTRELGGKKAFRIPDLLRTVKAPDFSAPDIEEDLVLFGIIASKSDPKVHQNTGKKESRGKFMIITLTDLKWELDLFLFDSAFDKFWKLTPGTIIAILNPGIMPPKRGLEDRGKFSLTLNSSGDTILEVGAARDLGLCKSIKKDGKLCDSWVDKRHTEYCSFHVNLAIDKTHTKRMEINTMNFGKGRRTGGGEHNLKFNGKGGGSLQKRREEENVTYDRESHSQIFITKRSTANMLDDVDFDPDAFHRGSSKEERIQRNNLAREKERELERKLGALGNGMGADYARKRSALPDLRDRDMVPAEPPPDAGALGLLGGKAKDVQLGPIKRKRAGPGSSMDSAAVGWGGDLTKQLGRMKDGESLRPVKKKTRFVTEKGIREAGRESIGGDAARSAANDFDDDDDDDDLDIVRE
jgi:minichromosome maintenance protein 10